MIRALEQINLLSTKMLALDDDAREGFGSVLSEVALNARHQQDGPQPSQQALVVEMIRRSLRWWREVGHDRHYSQRCTARVVRCLRAAHEDERWWLDEDEHDEPLQEAFNVLYELLGILADMPDIQQDFLCSRIECIGRDFQHGHGPGEGDYLDLSLLWGTFDAHSYDDLVYGLLAWCHESDNYRNVSEVCGWLFGCLPDTPQVRQILEQGIADANKSERLRERFNWIYSRQFNRNI